MNRIIDANLNRATEAARVIEEIARFYLDSVELSSKIRKNLKARACYIHRLKL